MEITLRQILLQFV